MEGPGERQELHHEGGAALVSGESGGGEGEDRDRCLLPGCTGCHDDEAAPPRVTVAVPEVVFGGGGGAMPPGAIHVDPPVG